MKDIPKENLNICDLYYLKGICELYAGNSEKAYKLFKEGMRLDPDNNKCRLALKTAKKCEELKECGNAAIKASYYD